MTSILVAIITIAQAVSFLLLIYVILSILISFDILNTRQRFVAQVYHALGRLFDPVLNPIRNALPPTGGFDFSPLVLFIILMVIERVAAANLS